MDANLIDHPTSKIHPGSGLSISPVSFNSTYQPPQHLPHIHAQPFYSTVTILLTLLIHNIFLSTTCAILFCRAQSLPPQNNTPQGNSQCDNYQNTRASSQLSKRKLSKRKEQTAKEFEAIYIINIMRFIPIRTLFNSNPAYIHIHTLSFPHCPSFPTYKYTSLHAALRVYMNMSKRWNATLQAINPTR